MLWNLINSAQYLYFQSLKAPDLKERLQESEKLMTEMSKTWEEKLQETERIHSVSRLGSLLITFIMTCK